MTSTILCILKIDTTFLYVFKLLRIVSFTTLENLIELVDSLINFDSEWRDRINKKAMQTHYDK